MNEIIKKNGISFGVGLGIFSILMTTVIYAVDLSLFANMWLGLGFLLIALVTYIILLSKTKKELHGNFTFKEAFTTFFIAALIGTALSVLYNIVLFNFVDPSAKDAIREVSIKSTVSMLEKFGTPAAQINETVDKMSENDAYSIESQLMGLAISLCVSAVLGLILALIFKSRPAHNE